MLDHAKSLIAKTLTSRKWWATVAAVITFGLAGEWHEAGLAIMAYVGVQGAVDGMGARKEVSGDVEATEGD